jgi:hypothetical protein
MPGPGGVVVIRPATISETGERAARAAYGVSENHLRFENETTTDATTT